MQHFVKGYSHNIISINFPLAQKLLSYKSQFVTKCCCLRKTKSVAIYLQMYVRVRITQITGFNLELQLFCPFFFNWNIIYRNVWKYWTLREIIYISFYLKINVEKWFSFALLIILRILHTHICRISHRSFLKICLDNCIIVKW